MTFPEAEKLLKKLKENICKTFCGYEGIRDHALITGCDNGEGYDLTREFEFIEEVLEAQKIIDAEVLNNNWKLQKQKILDIGQSHIRFSDVEEFIKNSQKTILN